MGDCTAMAGASFDCTGSCSGNCTGSCSGTASAPVMCQGKCDGTCSATQSDGSCMGTCTGKCTLAANAKVMCSGTCSGQCDAKCSPPMGSASVQCSGSCSAMAQPLSCKGGTLQGGCMVDAKCQGNCNASAQASAQCTPPAVTITVSGMASAAGQLDTLVNTLETNLPNLLLVVKARGMAFADVISQVSASGSATISGGIDAQGAACLAQIAPAVAQAATDFPLAVSASVNVLGSVKIQ